MPRDEWGMHVAEVCFCLYQKLKPLVNIKILLGVK